MFLQKRGGKTKQYNLWPLVKKTPKCPEWMYQAHYNSSEADCTRTISWNCNDCWVLAPSPGLAGPQSAFWIRDITRRRAFLIFLSDMALGDKGPPVTLCWWQDFSYCALTTWQQTNNYNRIVSWFTIFYVYFHTNLFSTALLSLTLINDKRSSFISKYNKCATKRYLTRQSKL